MHRIAQAPQKTPTTGPRVLGLFPRNQGLLCDIAGLHIRISRTPIWDARCSGTETSFDA